MLPSPIRGRMGDDGSGRLNFVEAEDDDRLVVPPLPVFWEFPVWDRLCLIPG